MNYYKFLEEGDTDQIIPDMCKYLANKYSLDNYTYSYNKRNDYMTVVKHYELFIRSNGKTYRVDVYEDNDILGTSDKIITNAHSFFKYYNKKQIINDLI